MWRILIPRIDEYLCDSCDASFSSSMLVQNHKKKSCIGVKQSNDPENEKKRLEYKIKMGYTKVHKECKECKECKCLNCVRDVLIDNLVNDNIICCKNCFIKKCK